MRVSLEKASKLLCSGQVVAVPTETVYGLAAALDQPQAIHNVFKLKQRPQNNPLIIHVSNINALQSYTSHFPTGFIELAEAFWPGPLTIVLPIDETKIPLQVRAGLPTAAFRIPNCPLTLSLLEQTGPLVMPSANLSGKPSATQPQHIERDFGENFPVLDGGNCRYGLESTIIIFQNERWQIIRLGSIASENFLDILGYVPHIANKVSDKPLCPGQMYRHYAPKAKLVLSQNFSGIVIGFADRSYPQATKVFLLGSTISPENVAENLYAILRQLDDENIATAVVDMNFPKTGLWVTIRERLEKAASGRK